MGENRLSKESSLYLQQHAENPVDWWPWCDEAFEVAKKENKPVLVSIGYSSCHWCHVMAHECFEDEYIADMMNKMFVNIKVDREERPDLDQIYMEAVQMFNQPGGWPLNVFCFPNKKPFTGGTYFPPEDRGHGIVPWPHFLVRIAEAYKMDQEQLRTNADAITSNLEYLSGSLLQEDRKWDSSILIDGAQRICSTLDPQFGGFGDAPKFPPSQILGFLYALEQSSMIGENHELVEAVDKSLSLCAHAMVRGGLYDHVGGGFFRYSVDQQWRVPHFEKMLYDNGLIVELLSKLWSRGRWIGLEKPVEKTIDWLISEFQVFNGVFASGLDADSEEGEGAYYTWSEGELKERLSSTLAESFCNVFSVSGKDPLNLYPWIAEDAEYLRFEEALDELQVIRKDRNPPVKDEKVILSWNALVLRALTIAGQVFGQDDWLRKAQEGLDWIWENFFDDNRRLGSVYYKNKGVSGEAFLDDYVNFALANVHFGAIADTLDTGLGKIYMDRAKSIADSVIEQFIDQDGEGFFFCSENGAEDLIVRKKEWFDNAVPCGNSSTIHLFSYLDICYDQPAYRQILEEQKLAYIEKARRMPNGVSFGLEGFVWDSVGILHIKIGKSISSDDVLDALRSKSWRPFVLEVNDEIGVSKIELCSKGCCYPQVDTIGALMEAIENI